MKYLLFTLLFTGFIYQTKAQNSEYKTTDNQIITVNSSTDESIRKIFQKIAEGNRQSTSSLKHSINFKKTVRILTEGRTGGKYRIKIEVQAQKNTSNLEYRRFPIQESLTPNFIACKVWDKTTSSSGKMLKEFRNLRVQNNNIYRGELEFSHLKLAKDLKITIENIEPHYTSSTESQFQKELDKIDRYYREKEQLERFQGILDRINLNNLEEIEENGEKLKRVERKIRETQRLKSELNLTQNDPNYLLPALRKLDATHRALEQKFKSINENRHISYYQNGMEVLKRGRTSEAVRYLKLAVKHEPNYAPAQLALARLELQSGNLDDSRDNIQKLRNLRNTDAETSREIRLFYGDVYDKYLQRADRQQNSKNYQQAMNDYSEAKEVANFLNDSQYEREVERKIRILKNDQFNQLVTNTNDQFNRYQPNLRGIYQQLNEAETFQNSNRQYIDNQEVLNQTYVRLYHKSLNEIDAYLLKKNRAFQYQNEVEECLSVAKEICNKDKIQTNCRAEIGAKEGKIKENDVKLMANQAENLMNQGNFAMAYKVLSDAENHIKNNQIQIQNETITHSAWKRYFKNKFLEINKLIQNKRFDEAISNLEKANSDLEKLPQINLKSEIENLAKKAYSGKFETGLTEVSRKINAKNYQSANQQLKEVHAFQKTYASYISNPKKSQIESQYVSILKGLIQESETEIRAENFNKALLIIKEINEIINYKPSEKQKVKSNLFAIFMGLGNQSENQKAYKKAVRFYEKAEYLAKNENISNATKSAQKAKIAKEKNAHFLIVENIEEASKKVNSSEIKTAQKLSNEISELVEKYNLKLETNSAKKFESLRENIRLEVCRIAKNDLETVILEAENNIKKQLFSRALNELEIGIRDAKKVTACPIETSKAEKLVQKYADAGTYQNMINQAQKDLQAYDYQKFELNYLKAESYYKTNKVSSFGISHTDFQKFVLKNQHNQLLKFLVLRYAEKDLKFTKMLLNKLVVQDFDKQAMRDLGREIAQKDFVKFGDKKAKQIVEKYKFSKEGFRQFRKGYLDGWGA